MKKNGNENLSPHSGYFCPEGQKNPDDHPCPEGYHCPSGASEKTKCESGSYQDEPIQSTCKTCPAGEYRWNIRHCFIIDKGSRSNVSVDAVCMWGGGGLKQRWNNA